MKSASVSMMKSRRRSCPQRMVPKEGSRLRHLYDAIVSQKCEAVDISAITSELSKHARAQLMNQLRQNYELDIRRVGINKYSLVGEWVGAAYIDYLAEKQEHYDATKNRG